MSQWYRLILSTKDSPNIPLMGPVTGVDTDISMELHVSF